MRQPREEEGGAGQEQDQSVVPHPASYKTLHKFIQVRAWQLVPVAGCRQSCLRYFVRLHCY